MKKLKNRLNSEIACYNFVQNHLSSCILSQNLKVKVYKTVTVPIILVLRRIFSHKREEVTKG